ncbi:MAG TPA: hypothetical protein VFY87_27090 [Geminicoccaceae bacterium]|nr:hypothetical protein [Geminicoccaceae bacterium]
MPKPPPSKKKRTRVENDLIERLSGPARTALRAQLFAWPVDPIPPDHIADFVAEGMAAAREVLRLYPWPSEPCPEGADGWPWQTERYDRSGWRPIDPDWEPEPAVEYLNCWPDLDPAPFRPDLRLTAFELLHWLAALREATAPDKAAVATWRAADAIGRLNRELELGAVVRTGIKQRVHGAMKGAAKVRKTDVHEEWAAADAKLEAEGVRSARERARRLTASGSKFAGVGEGAFRNAVREARKKVGKSLA